MKTIVAAMGIVSSLACAQVRTNTFEFVSGQLVSGPPVKGAPYSAEAVNETIRVLADGNRIVQRSSAKQYRDIDGRERREETSAMGVIFITDPVAGVRYTLHPESRSAEKGPAASFGTGGGDVFFYSNSGAAGLGRGGEMGITTMAAGRGAPDLSQHVMVTAGRVVTGLNEAKTEQLGNMYIEGVQAQGTRSTVTIPAGDIGNELPITIVDERWYSPELQITVMTKHVDPMVGETTYRLSHISQASPPAYLFEVPPDYTVRSGPAFTKAILAEPRRPE